MAFDTHFNDNGAISSLCSFRIHLSMTFFILLFMRMCIKYARWLEFELDFKTIHTELHAYCLFSERLFQYIYVLHKWICSFLCICLPQCLCHYLHSAVHYSRHSENWTWNLLENIYRKTIVVIRRIVRECWLLRLEMTVFVCMFCCCNNSLSI